MQAFKNSCEVLTKLSSDKSISIIDMRMELAKIEAQHKQIRAEKASIKSKFLSADDVELTAKFTELVGEKFKSYKEAGLTYLQTEVKAESTVPRPQAAASVTKKETVMLPVFSGDERTAYLK